jgi:TetR/AcrR family transcriptional regulator, ethionamide resistance regulator
MGAVSSAAKARETRRQRHAEVRSRVKEAALALVEDTPFKDLTVDEIAREAGITRSAFYLYFRDKHDLLMEAAAEVADELYREADRWWHGAGDPEALIREALEGVTAVYASHARLLGVAVEVSTYDEEVSRFWLGLVERFINATAAHLEREQEARRVRPLDARDSAEGLVWMVERCLYVYLAQGDREPGELVDSLAPIWLAALYQAESARSNRSSGAR